MKRINIFLLCLCFINRSVIAQTVNDTVSILSYTQQLLDGISTGDTSTWNKYLDDKCILTIEDGSTKTKQEFIQKLQAPPPFMKVRETISFPLFRIYSNIIIFSYRANLFLDLFSQQRRNEICQMDTWLKTSDGWKLVASAAMDKFQTPLLKINYAETSKNILGDYSLGKEFSYKIFERDGKLYNQRTGRKETELICESDYYFFQVSNPNIKMIFVHDHDKVTELLLRRAGSDIIIPKVD